MPSVIETDRLYSRTWQDDDLDSIFSLHQHEEVMRFFPGIATKQACELFLVKMKRAFELKSYAYLPVFKRLNDQFIGWVGISDQDYLDPHFVDIGWRILPEFWGQGFATEMASAFLKYGFEECGLKEIFAVAPKLNEPSIAVMKRIGMHFESEFLHPLLSKEHYPDHSHLQLCVRFQLSKPSE